MENESSKALTEHVCKSCGADFRGLYCNVCGEKVIEPKDRSFRVFLSNILIATTIVDNKFVKSVFLTVGKPGFLSREYVDGRRVKYMRPLQMFFILNLIYFLFPVLQMFNSDEVHPTLFETPYFIGPDGDVAAKTYGLLSETLKQSGRIAVGKVVLRDRETPLLLAPHGRGIVMYRLRYPNEVRTINEVPQLLEVKADKEQLKLAKTLVDSMTKKFSDIEMKDHYYDALKTIIDAKIEGKEVVIVEEEAPKVVDIMTALKASIDAAKKPMEKAKGTGAAKAKEEKQKAPRRKAS